MNYVLNSCDEKAINFIISEINKGIIDSGKKRTILQLQKKISDTSTVEELNSYEEILVLFGDFENAPDLLEKCNQLKAPAEQRECKIANEEVNKLLDKLLLAKTFDEVDGIRDNLLLYEKYIDKNKIEERAETQRTKIRIENDKKKKKKKVIIYLSVASVFIIVLLIIQSGYWRAKILYSQGRYVSAVNALQNVPGLLPSNSLLSKANLEAGKKLSEQGKYNEAKKYFEASDEPDSVKYYMYADMLRDLEYGNMTGAYRTAIKLGNFLDTKDIVENNEGLKKVKELEGSKWNRNGMRLENYKSSEDEPGENWIEFKNGALIYYFKSNDGVRDLEVTLYYQYGLYTETLGTAINFDDNNTMTWYSYEWKRVK